MAGLSAARSVESGFAVVFVDEAGVERRAPLSSSWNIPFERVAAVRSFPSYRGQKNFPGLWWSATTGEHVGYESWVERDVLMMLDFDPEIIGFASQPFWLTWADDERVRRHAPDYFARTADGQGVVVDVRPDDRIDPASAESFAAMARACAEVGWEFRRTGGPSPVLRANVRWLAGYRHPRCRQEDIAGQLLAAFASPAPLLHTVQQVGDQLAVLPVLYHLLWAGQLTADLTVAPLNPLTMARAVAAL